MGGVAGTIRGVGICGIGDGLRRVVLVVRVGRVHGKPVLNRQAGDLRWIKGSKDDCFADRFRSVMESTRR